MTKVISVKFKGGGKSYYFAPCSQELEKGMGVIVETAKGLEYATVTEGLHDVDDSQIVPPLMPVVRIATKKDLEQIEKNEARKGEAMRIVREKIAARQLDMKPVGCEFSFDGTKVVVYFTSENRVDFRELIKDLSSAFHMRIELRQIGIREEIKLMGGLAPCGRECCCVRSLQEPKKVSVKMAKNQGLSLNPGKISGLCGRLMCCLSYENDFYADLCKKVPKLGSEATTPDGKGMVVNVNMLKMVVKVKIEQGDSVTYRDYPVDKISFMRGNEVIGSVGGDDDEETVGESEEEELDALVNASAKDGGVISADGERRHGEKNEGDGRNRRNGGEQGKELRQNGGKNRKNRFKQRGEQGSAEKNGDGTQKNQNTNGHNGVQANSANGNRQNGRQEPAVNFNQQNNNQSNSNRNRKKRRHNKNYGAGENNGVKANPENQKNNG
ncbi:MAG: regulatory iron-sulfur-containing complex subunit RicT [Candidatus Coproplasma sp.]